MSKQKLDLIQFTACIPTEPRTGSPQVVGCKGRDTDPGRGRPHHVPYSLLTDAIPEHSTRTTDTPKDLPAVDRSRTEPGKQFHVHPVGHRDSADMTGLAHKIDDGPMVCSLLQVFDSQAGGLMSPQCASQEKSQQGTVTFAFHSCVVRTLPQRESLLIGQPVSDPHAILLQTLHRRMPAARSELSSPQSAASQASRRTAPSRRLMVVGANRRNSR